VHSDFHFFDLLIYITKMGAINSISGFSLALFESREYAFQVAIALGMARTHGHTGEIVEMVCGLFCKGDRTGVPMALEEILAILTDYMSNSRRIFVPVEMDFIRSLTVERMMLDWSWYIYGQMKFSSRTFEESDSIFWVRHLNVDATTVPPCEPSNDSMTRMLACIRGTQ
jgi:hypothetical protein